MLPVKHGARAAAALSDLMAYVSRDKGADTTHRVEWTEGVNLPVNDAASCEKLMLRTVADAPALKRAAGMATTGKKLKVPFEHLSLSYPPGEPRPTRAQMMADAREALKARGYSRCQAFVACHRDTDHAHVHIVACRVDPQTGRATKPTHMRELMRWAEKHEERTHGRLAIPNRRARRLVREHNATEIRAAMKENREPRNLKKLPPMERKRVRTARGRPAARRTAKERRAFRDLYERHRQDGTAPDQARQERIALARTQAEARARAQKAVVTAELRALTEHPAQAPAPVPVKPAARDLPPRVFVVGTAPAAPAPPAPVPPVPSRRTPSRVFVAGTTPAAPDPPVPVWVPEPDRTPTTPVAADNPPPPRPATTHDSKPAVRGRGRPVGGGPAPAAPSRPARPRSRP